jgi:formate hydrogenlyase subunit 4
VTAYGLSVLQILAVAVGGLLLTGLMAKVRARAEGRVGAPVTQPLREVVKWLGRESPRATGGALMGVVPVVLLVTTALAAAIAPLAGVGTAGAGGADALVVVFLLLTGSLALALGGLATATAFGGMGASRAMTLSALTEPALLVAVAAFAVPGRSMNLATLVRYSLAHPAGVASPSHVLATVALLMVVVAETGRMPVDNPSTHLELTMIHEAMVLEYGGRDYALVSLGGSMRLGLLLGLLATLAVPWGVAPSDSVPALGLGLVLLAVKAGALALGVALVEVRTAKLRLFRVPELLAAGFVLAALAVVVGVVVR